VKKLLLSAAILTAFIADAKAMDEQVCPDEESLRFAVGRLTGEKVGQTADFTDEKGIGWHMSNVQNPGNKNLTNLVTGANPVFTYPAPGMCHVSFDKIIDTPAGKGTGVSTILTLDLKQEK
jgi:hypothetical protein